MLKRSKSFAFTLIELLIVVAIIAILAAIAVPNFLEAQTRAKVSRTASDLRVFDTAAETYRIDYNRLPRTSRNVGESRLWMSHYLTTPIAYMNGGLPDVFNKIEANPDDRYLVAWGPDYFFGTADGSPTDAGKSAWGPRLKNFPMYSDGTVLTRTKFFFMFSLGPDQKYDILTPAWPSPVEQYDATNGTLSKGDLVRING